MEGIHLICLTQTDEDSTVEWIFTQDEDLDFVPDFQTFFVMPPFGSRKHVTPCCTLHVVLLSW